MTSFAAIISGEGTPMDDKTVCKQTNWPVNKKKKKKELLARQFFFFLLEPLGPSCSILEKSRKKK